MARHRALPDPRPRRTRRAALACGVALVTAFGCTAPAPEDPTPSAPASRPGTDGTGSPYVVTRGPGPIGVAAESHSYEVWARAAEPGQTAEGSSADEPSPAPHPDAGRAPAPLVTPPGTLAGTSPTTPARPATASPAAAAPTPGTTAPTTTTPTTTAPTTTAPTTPAPTTPPATDTALSVLRQIAALIAQAEADGRITPGIAQALSAPVQEALAAVARDYGAISACGTLTAFANLVEAQDGKAIPTDLAASLLTLAARATSLLPCA